MANIKLYLNSEEGAENGGIETDISFNITPQLSTNEYFNFTLTLESAEIPISFYNVNSNNNFFKYQLQSGGTITTFNIPIKNYTAAQLVIELNSLMTSLGVTVTYNQQTNKLKFTRADIGDGFQLRGEPFRLFGLVYDEWNLSSAGVIESPNMINLLYPRNCFVKLISTQDTTYNETIAKIQLSALEYEIVYFSGTIASEFSVTLTDKTLSQIRISLVDDAGNALGGLTGLSGIGWSIGLNIELVSV